MDSSPMYYGSNVLLCESWLELAGADFPFLTYKAGLVNI